MPAHPLQSALDALDEEAHRLVQEHIEAMAKYHQRRDELVQEIATSPSLVPDVPDVATDITQQEIK